MNNKIILYIDDDSDKWLKVLEPVAGYHGFTIIPSDSVKDGRLQLDNFNAVIDCVLLDLGFPNEKDQGKDLLKEIKEKYQNLPVIILTASDKAEDLRTAVECIKMGAFDYFGKERIDLEQLFNQINNSIDSNITNSVHNNLLKSINESDNPYIYTSAYNYNNSDLYYSHFVYRLNSIILPSNVESAKIYAELAVSWHRDLLSLITLLNIDVSLKISYRITIDKDNKKKQLNIYFIFSASGLTKDDADSNANKTFLEVNFYFSHRYLYQKGFYSFVIISDEKELCEILNPVNKDLKVSSFVKSNISLNFNDKIDLEKYSLGLLENRIIKSLGFSKPSLPSLEKFFDHLFDRTENTYFDVIAFPEKLSIDEIKFLKGLKEELSTKLLLDDFKVISLEINKFIDYPTQIYNITALIYSDSADNKSKLLMSVAKDFFSGSDSVEINEHVFNPSKLHKYFLYDYNKNEKIIINTYSYSNSIELIRLPFPNVIGHKGINPSNPVFDFLPPDISSNGPIIGTKSIDSSDKIIRISPYDLRKHLYILGQTGTGKSTTLFSMLMERANSGEGFALMDPHGDLTNEVMENIPENRKRDIIMFDPVENAKKNGGLALNLLEYDPSFPEQRTFIINELIKIIDDIYDLGLTGGPIFEQYFRAACFLVMDDISEKYTLQHIVTVFDNSVFRKELLSKCKDTSIKTLWEDIMLKTIGDYAFANYAPYITSKLTRFLNDHFLRPIITQRTSSINFRNIIDTNKILLIRLTKGRLGDVSTKFIGRILLNKLIMAAYSRENIEEKDRVDFTLFIDEFQNFISSDIENAMSEARKYHLRLVLANQTVAQINKDILNSVLGNVGSMIFFRPGILDAEQIKAFFEPYFTKQEMLNLPNYTCVAKLQINNQPSLPFVMKTIIQEELLKIIK